jgi:hypothetical protein
VTPAAEPTPEPSPVAQAPEPAPAPEAVPPTPTPVPEPEAAPVSHSIPAPAPETGDPIQRRSARQPTRARDANLAATRQAGNAPRTLRLDQDVANRMRASWLEAKHQDVLLTLQDFARRIIARGFTIKQPVGKRRSATTNVAEPPTAPQTLRIDQDSANQLRAAWLEAKRSDVLLTHQEYSSQLVESGLNAEQRAQQRRR